MSKACEGRNKQVSERKSSSPEISEVIMSSYGYATTERSGSTNSVYDYPEHLNPFYEDENHKRLRFWHFGGHRSDKPKSERRGSLVSIRDGLRDMW